MLYQIEMVMWLGLLSIEDIRNRSVAAPHLFFGGILVLLTSYFCGTDAEIFVKEAFIQALLPGMFLLSVAFLTRKAGYADGLVLLFLGASAGAERCMTVLFLSLLFAALVSLVLLGLKKADSGTQIAYIPYMLAGWIVTGVMR